MQPDAIERFQAALDTGHTWPGEYIFKFIVRPEHLPRLRELFAGCDIRERASRAGGYVSLTATAQMPDSAAVVAVYRAAAEIPGIISL